MKKFQISENLKEMTQSVSILLVEDDVTIRDIMAQLLLHLFPVVDVAVHGEEGLEKYKSREYDIVFTDIEMPVMNGLDMIQGIKEIKENQAIVVFSGKQELSFLIELIEMGVDSFLQKPVDNIKLLEVIEKILSYKKMNELQLNYQKNLEADVALKTEELSKTILVIQELSQEIVVRLSTAAEYRDNETGAHINRMGIYAERLAHEIGMGAEYIESIKFAAPLHDIGKIGIQDQILLKSGKLTKEESEIMKSHTTIGKDILSGSNNAMIRMSEEIALTHHEKWDGTGYPAGLAGEKIPLSGRILTICDQYDALRSIRPYKGSMTHEETCDIIIKGDGRTLPDHFDPQILEAFKKVKDYFNDIFNTSE